MPSRLELRAQLEIVEDFTIERHPDLAIFVMNRLLSACQIDDAESRVSQADAGSGKETGTIRSAMAKLTDNRRQIRIGFLLLRHEVSEPGDPAHIFFWLSARHAGT